MKTIASCVQEILVSRPFLEEALAREIINFSALAKDLNATISEMLRKPVKDGAITMALRRYNQALVDVHDSEGEEGKYYVLRIS